MNTAIWFVLLILDVVVFCPMMAAIAGVCAAIGAYVEDVQFAWRRQL